MTDGAIFRIIYVVGMLSAPIELAVRIATGEAGEDALR